MPPHAGALAPASIGEGVPTTVLFLTPRPGDEIELLAAEAIGVADGATVRFYFSPPVRMADGSYVVGEELRDLAGATFANTSETDGPDDTVGVVAEITAQRRGRYELTSVRLHYRINGGPERVGEGTDVVFVVCADDPKPARCEEE